MDEDMPKTDELQDDELDRDEPTTGAGDATTTPPTADGEDSFGERIGDDDETMPVDSTSLPRDKDEDADL